MFRIKDLAVLSSKLRISLFTIFLGMAVIACPTFGQSKPSDVRGKYAEIGGMKMYYEIHGTGKPLLLLHWYDGTGRHSWGPFIEQLSSEYQLIIPDLRGHGLTRNPTDSFSMRQCSVDVELLLDHLKIRQCDAMGASLGGMSLLHLSSRSPDRIGTMVLIGSGCYLSEEGRNFMRDEVKNLYQDQPEHLKQMKTLHPGGDDQVEKLARLFGELANKYDDLNFTPPYLATIKARTLIVSGDDDPYFPARMQVEMHSAIPRSSLWIIPKGGHLPHMDMVDAFARLTLRFLKEK